MAADRLRVGQWAPRRGERVDGRLAMAQLRPARRATPRMSRSRRGQCQEALGALDASATHPPVAGLPGDS